MTQLRLMNEKEYRQFLDYAITNYAEEKVRAGNFLYKDALDLSTQEYQRLLPEGLATHDSYLYSIVDEHLRTSVGFIWLLVEHTGLLRYATVVNVLVYEQFRRQGHGRQAFQLIEEEVRHLGIDRITLHVFAHNHEARSLYQRIGYGETNVLMAKKLANR